MEKTNVQKLAKILKILVTITFVCNLIVLPLVPGIVGMGAEYGLWGAAKEFGMFGPEFGPLIFLAVCWQYLTRVWRSQYTTVLTLFLLACGVCTAIVLWQARKVLGTILEGNPFQKRNGTSLKQAGVCCFGISCAALIRAVWRLVYFDSLDRKSVV